jgi:hypothetical protein
MQDTIQCPGDEVVSAFDLPAHAQRTVRCGYERWIGRRLRTGASAMIADMND